MTNEFLGKILVTGAKGMLGQDLCPMLEDCGYEVVETDIHNLDITNELEVYRIISNEKPDFVIHCAAYTNVDKAEDEPEIVEKINATATGHIAKACKLNNLKMIYISTDYVFDGNKNESYLPEDEPNPLNTYGKTKLEGEIAVKVNCPQSYIVRTSWLYGHHGKNFVETMIKNANNPSLTVVDDQVGCPTWTIDLADGIISLIEEEAEYGTYHLCGGGQTSWYNFAKEIFANLNLNTNLIACKSIEYPQKAKRPHFSAMENQNALRNWKLALQEYIELRIE